MLDHCCGRRTFGTVFVDVTILAADCLCLNLLGKTKLVEQSYSLRNGDTADTTDR